MERWRILVLTIIFCLSAMQVSAENNYGPTVRVGWFLVDGLQEMDPIEGTYDGYNYVYLKAIAQFTGWQYRFVPGTFAECMERLEKGEIDIEGRIDSLTYSEPKNVTKQTESLLGRLFK